jgi:hypothetical protein
VIFIPSWPFRQMGELEVDHRASPGLPEDIALLVGYDPKLSGEGKVYRQHTMTCSHCKGVVVKNPARTRERATCMKCGGHYICDGCAFKASQPDYVHTPFEKMAEQIIHAADLVSEGSPPKLLTS